MGSSLIVFHARHWRAADRHRHPQRRLSQVGVVVLAEAEPDDAPGAHVQDRVEVELALVGGYLGAVAVPLAVDLLSAELAADQVRCPPPSPALPGRAAAPPSRPCAQPQLTHDRRDRVDTDPPPLITQVRGDPRRPVQSAPAETMRSRPSRVPTATAQTQPVWPVSWASSAPVPGSHTRTVPSAPAETMRSRSSRVPTATARTGARDADAVHKPLLLSCMAMITMLIAEGRVPPPAG